MFLLLSFFAWFASVGAQNASQTRPGPVVDVGYAKFRGIVNETWGATAYYAMRYAQPPTGNFRFRAPRPIEGSNYYNTSEPIDASVQGPICIRGDAGFQLEPDSAQPKPGSEDCLLLDILVPNKPVAESLPVLVQIHGGGFAVGNAELWPGYSFVNHSQAIVYVSIQYRLNAFGFLSSVEVREDGDANAGILDQRVALNWIQRHISAFGGDPTKVTIHGQSAGGASVMAHMILYGGDDSPPFRAAISEHPWWQPYHNDTILGDQYNEVLKAAQCNDLACLRSVPSDVLNAASQAAQIVGYQGHPQYYGFGDYYYGPSVDGDAIRDLPSNEFKQGHFTKVPLLTDRETYEGYYFTNKSTTTQDLLNTDLQQVWPYAKRSFFTRLYELYPADAFNSTFFRRLEIFGDFIIKCPTYYMATATSDNGMPTWKMDFNAGTKQHGATFAYLFSTDPRDIDNVTLARIMKDWFLSFAIHLDPNVESFSDEKKPYWPPYQGEGEAAAAGLKVMQVNDTSFGVIDDPDANPRCDFFHGQSYAVRN